jgi:hypothetical protein
MKGNRSFCKERIGAAASSILLADMSVDFQNQPARCVLQEICANTTVRSSRRGPWQNHSTAQLRADVLKVLWQKKTQTSRDGLGLL